MKRLKSLKLTGRLLLAVCMASFAASTAFATEPAAKDKHHVYLLIGQSNMAGRAAIPPEDVAPLPGAWLLTKDGAWESAKPPLNIHSTIRKGEGMQKLNPGTQFAANMLAENPDTTIGLVVNARGGSKIEQWDKSHRFYKEAVRRTRQAMKSGTLKGILWHQGESNHSDPDYLVKLKALVANLRLDLDDKRLPFVVAEINTSRQNYPVNEQLLKLPAELKFTACVSSEGLTATDAWHFDTASQKLLGERYAKAMSGLLKGKKPAKKRVDQNDPDLPRVLLIGDSITSAYSGFVRKAMQGEATVVFQGHGTTGRALSRFIKRSPVDGNWDVIHFNWGLHDLCYRHPDAKPYGNRDKVNGTVGTTLEDYEKNLDRFVGTLKKSGAELIWAQTTVVPEGEAGRIVGDDLKYNRVAAGVMKKHGVTINDLSTLTRGFDASYFTLPGDVHYKPGGSHKIAEQVVTAIRAKLKK